MADESYEVSLSGVSVGYDGKPLIHDINIQIPKGKIVVLIGPNGAGKSTILKSITRQLALISGTVCYAGKSMEDLSSGDMAKEVAVMLTERIAEEQMSVRDVASMGRYPYTGKFGLLSDADEEKVTQALRTVHALDIADRPYQAISDGQKQRVLLARALAQEPEVLVLDEPTSYLDVRYKLELLQVLIQCAREKQMTVILSLHEIDLAQKIADQILCVKGETIFRYGDPGDIFQADLIRELYDLDNGYYDPRFGSIELPGPRGEPKVFVLSSGGTGIPMYRQLSRAQVPFTAGILYPGDADYAVARVLAARVVETDTWGPLSEETVAQARQEMELCETVLDCGPVTGSWDDARLRLLTEAKANGKLKKRFSS